MQKEKNTMFDIQRVTIDWADRPLTLETGRIARQARQQLEAQTGQPVVTGANYLPPQAPTAMPELPAPKAKSVRTPRKKP